RAEAAMVENDDPFVRFVEKSISAVVGEQEFIHQYHGGSDIRFPILYGNSRCVGIGPYCELPKQGSEEKEWIDIDDYLKGIAILTTILLDYGKQDIDNSI
ncbi:MAG: M20/M25/M40 family metallo-hydrolase, partial [Erysipelotrichaceae bacterium]|nr:M20/M25/M40 family metallo-hydrolase [Erysipelotrichaceae bacterium]